MLCDYPRTMIEVIYVALYERLGHVVGLLFCGVGTVFLLCSVVYGVGVIWISVCALDHPVTVCYFAHGL